MQGSLRYECLNTYDFKYQTVSRVSVVSTHHIANFLESVPAKEFSKSVNIWWRYEVTELEFGVYFLLAHGEYLIDN